MSTMRKYSFGEMSGDLAIYFNWSINALVPVYPKGADMYLKGNKSAIIRSAQELLGLIGFIPSEIYRGVLLKEKVNSIQPHENIEYLCFSESQEVAGQFANINGFGSEIIDLKKRLGEFGYIIKFTPHIAEVLFHYKLLDVLPYSDALFRIGMNGSKHVEWLKKQKEVTIIQPEQPFTQITNQF